MTPVLRRFVVIVLLLMCTSCVLVCNAPKESLDQFEKLLRLEFQYCEPAGDEEDKEAIKELRKTLLEYIEAWRERIHRAERSWSWRVQE